jgi:hypothetical protein
MPLWLTIIASILTGIAAALVSIGIIWKKLLLPIGGVVRLIVDLHPLLESLLLKFGDKPNAFAVLDEIAEQFKTNDGSSLRDVVDRLEKAAAENKISADQAKAAADFLKIGVEATRQVSEIDRATVRRVEVLLDRLGVKVEESAATGKRMEYAAGVVAEDLAAAHKRADEAGEGEPGAAADAAAQTVKVE